MAFSLRLPLGLDADARARADALGITLNGLICVALDAYLRPSAAVGLPLVVASQGGHVVPAAVESVKALVSSPVARSLPLVVGSETRQQRRARERRLASR